MMPVVRTMANSEAATSHSDADVHRQSAAGKGEIDSGLAIADIEVKMKPLHRLSDEVSVTTCPYASSPPYASSCPYASSASSFGARWRPARRTCSDPWR